MRQILLAVSMALLASSAASIANAATEADVEKSFFPYKDGPPTADGVTPGAVINKDNVDQFKAVLDEGMYKVIKNGWYEIKVGKTTSFDQDKFYIDATKKNIGGTKLGAKTGDIEGFVAGRPFP